MAQLLLPIAGALYFVFSYVFEFLPNGQVVVGVIVSIIAILGIILTLSSRSYLAVKRYDGNIIVSKKKDGKQLYSLEINRNPEDLAHMDTVLFKVAKD